MSSEDTGVTTLRITSPSDRFPFQAQVEIPVAGLNKHTADQKVVMAIGDWAAREDWVVTVDRCFNDVNEDGLRVRVGLFTVHGLIP